MTTCPGSQACIEFARRFCDAEARDDLDTFWAEVQRTMKAELEAQARQHEMIRNRLANVV